MIWRGRTLGVSARALELSEAGYKPVAYIPREDLDLSLFERSGRVTTCPYKGDANYFSLHDGQARDENAVWTYERPKPEVAEIASHLAFYPSRVEVERVSILFSRSREKVAR